MLTEHQRSRLAAHALPLLLILIPISTSAQGGGSQHSYEDTRHFEGERFITLTNVRVYAQPSLQSNIVRDVPRIRMVYAKPTKDSGWLEVFGAGVNKHPYGRQGILGPVQVEDGKLVLQKRRIDRNIYRPFSGYVKANALGSLDHPLPLPGDLGRQKVRIEGPLEDIGVPEPRFMPRDPSVSPFRSVVRVLVGDPIKKQCTGFVVEKTGLIATSGHCFEEGRATEKIRVWVPSHDGSSKFDVVTARLVYWNVQSEQSLNDSALLEVTDNRIHRIPPLGLATPGPWQRAGAVNVMTVGFAGDLDSVKAQSKSLSVPHASTCTLPAGHVLVHAEKRIIGFVPDNIECVVGPGDSGGPMLIFNSASNRYEAIGIATRIRMMEKNQRSLSNEARALLEIARQSQSKRFGREVQADDLNGMSALRNAIDRSSSTYSEFNPTWLLDERLYQEVSALVGKGPSFQVLLDGLQTAQSSMADWPEAITYRVHNIWTLDEFRQARLTLSLPLPKEDARQAFESYGYKFERQSLRDQGVGFSILRFGKVLEVGRPLVRQSEFDDYAKWLDPQVERLVKEKPELRASVENEVYDIRNQVLVESGPDLYVLNKDAIITEVIRNWMRDFKGSSGGNTVALDEYPRGIRGRPQTRSHSRRACAVGRCARRDGGRRAVDRYACWLAAIMRGVRGVAALDHTRRAPVEGPGSPQLCAGSKQFKKPSTCASGLPWGERPRIGAVRGVQAPDGP